ncbi:MAG: flagellar hook-associated protein FlgL [Pseudomonadota bacterium]|uniref:flagellar hook-associated protein FlgL n=1 Tax=Sphingomonas sp. ERG5 TaxID=1381597 RepID=UPI00054BE63D|nr:flagellar hook-associated protein FlgL [Sphingomonas sp. ERG5]
MQISTSQLYDRSTSLMAKLSQKADKLQTQISTETKILAPSDNAVGYRQLTTLKTDKADDKAYAANISLAQGLLDQSDTTLGSVETQLQRAQELAIQAGSGTLSNENRKVLAGQVRALISDMVGLANTKDVRGQPLFGAATGDSAVSVAGDGTVSFVGTGEPSAIPIGDGNDVRATDSAARIFGGIPTSGGGTTDIFAMLGSFADSLEAGSNPTATAAATEGLKTALAQVTQARGSVGARGARMDLEAQRLKDVGTTREITRSAIEDTDVPTTIMELQKTMTILSATQASFTKLSSLSLFNYLS